MRIENTLFSNVKRCGDLRAELFIYLFLLPALSPENASSYYTVKSITYPA